MYHNFILYCEDLSAGFTRRNVKKIQKAMRGFVKSDVRLAAEIIFTDEEEIRRLNRELRGVDAVTDVLSFPAFEGIKGKPVFKSGHQGELDERGNLLVGSIAVCTARAVEQAKEYGHSYNRELHYLIVHGIMHCLGYDHMTDGDKAEMRRAEEQILGKLHITRED